MTILAIPNEFKKTLFEAIVNDVTVLKHLKVQSHHPVRPGDDDPRSCFDTT